MSKAWAGGSPRAWRAVRRQVLIRDGYRCLIKGPNCTIVATTADHVIPKSQGGTDDPANLRAACGPCNQSRGAGSPDPEPLRTF